MTRDNFKQTQKASVVFAGETTGVRYVGDRFVAKEFVTNWFNTGQIPAKHAVTQTNYRVMKEMPEGFTFPDSDKQYWKHISIAPHEKPSIVGANIPIKDFIDVGPDAHAFFWGWIVYNDGFPEDQDQLTEFCIASIHVTWINNTPPLDDPKNDIHDVGFGDCKPYPHDCYDQDCPDYAEVVKRARAR